jgi:glycosyltransferase involved in cell wall biosynthesis
LSILEGNCNPQCGRPGEKFLEISQLPPESRPDEGAPSLLPKGHGSWTWRQIEAGDSKREKWNDNGARPSSPPAAGSLLKPMPPPHEPKPVSAYIPCYNNAGSIGQAIRGIQEQTHPVDELFVVDDGSTDGSAEVAERLGVPVIRQGTNQGRGAARARAMEVARNEFVLCCDATNRLAPNFVEGALAWFTSEEVFGVYGRWIDRNAQTLIDRWRARHLFQQDIVQKVAHGSDLSTHGAMVRKSVTLRFGNYNRLLRHGEDFELGTRFMEWGDVIFDPALEVQPVVHNTYLQVMERYSRWNRAAMKNYTLSNFFDSHVVAWKIMIPRDIKSRDWMAAAISATVPYFSFAHAEKRHFTFTRERSTEKANAIYRKK